MHQFSHIRGGFLLGLIHLISQTVSVSIITILTISLGPTFGTAFGVSKDDLHTCDEGPYPIVVHVQGIRNEYGTIKAKLYGDNPHEFLVSGKKLNAKRVPIHSKSTRLCLYAPNPGTYAIVVHHDENGNKKLDQNWIGMPTEGVGFSNNPKLFLATPSHEEVAFPVIDGITNVDITLQY